MTPAEATLRWLLSEAHANTAYRRVLDTGHAGQVVAMFLTGRATIPLEAHREGVQQFVAVWGEAQVIVAGVPHLLREGKTVRVPPGVLHEVRTVRGRPVALLTVYHGFAPHRPGLVQQRQPKLGREHAANENPRHPRCRNLVPCPWEVAGVGKARQRCPGGVLLPPTPVPKGWGVQGGRLVRVAQKQHNPRAFAVPEDPSSLFLAQHGYSVAMRALRQRGPAMKPLAGKAAQAHTRFRLISDQLEDLLASDPRRFALASAVLAGHHCQGVDGCPYGQQALRELGTRRANRGKPRLGSGARFRALIGQLEARGTRDPRALAAWIGRQKYGSARMAKMAATGRRRAKGG